MGGGVVDTTACGLMWKVQLKRDQREAGAGNPAEVSLSPAAAAVQQQLDESLAAAAAVPPAADRAVVGAWQCEYCASRDMFCHRPGPGGMGTLCNGMVNWGVAGAENVKDLFAGG